MRLVMRLDFLSTWVIGTAMAIIWCGLLSTVTVAKEVKVGTATLVLP
jgi:hypothetical protein